MTQRRVVVAMVALALGALGAYVWHRFLALGDLPAAGVFDRADNGLRMRRHWIHGGMSDEERAELARSLESRGIRRIYPFLGPMDPACPAGVITA